MVAFGSDFLDIFLLHTVAGGLLLLLAALDKDRGSAMGACFVLTLLLRGPVTDPPELDPQMCSALLQLGVVERLSQLLHPVLQPQDSAETAKLGESSSKSILFVHQCVSLQLVLHVVTIQCSSCQHIECNTLQSQTGLKLSICCTLCILPADRP